MKKFTWVVMIAFLFGLLAACAPSTEQSSSGSSSDTGSDSGSESNSNEEVITIKWVDYQSNEPTTKAIEDVIAAYEAENPNVNIERTYVPFGDLKNQLLMGTAAGSLPDIVQIDNPDHQSFSEAGILADITEYVEEWGEADQYFDGPMSSAMFDGKYYGLPGTSNNLALYYNEDMFAEAGIAPPTTWDELKEAAAALTKDGVYGMSLSAVNNEQGTFQFLPFVYQAGSDLDDFNSQGTVEALSLWKEFYDNGYMSRDVLTMEQADVLLQFSAGNAAMMVNGTWQIPALENEPPDFNWNVVTLPEYKQGGTILGGENWAITATSDHIDIAWDIIKFANEKENLLTFSKAAGRMPGRMDYIQDPHWQEDEKMKVFAEGMDVAKARAYGPNYPEMSIAIQEMLYDVMSNGIAPEEAVDKANQKIEPLLP
jgi:multiple sugar transport system substrate-binding protein